MSIEDTLKRLGISRGRKTPDPTEINHQAAGILESAQQFESTLDYIANCLAEINTLVQSRAERLGIGIEPLTKAQTAAETSANQTVTLSNGSNILRTVFFTKNETDQVTDSVYLTISTPEGLIFSFLTDSKTSSKIRLYSVAISSVSLQPEAINAALWSEGIHSNDISNITSGKQEKIGRLGQKTVDFVLKQLQLCLKQLAKEELEAQQIKTK